MKPKILLVQALLLLSVFLGKGIFSLRKYTKTPRIFSPIIRIKYTQAEHESTLRALKPYSGHLERAIQISESTINGIHGKFQIYNPKTWFITPAKEAKTAFQFAQILNFGSLYGMSGSELRKQFEPKVQDPEETGKITGNHLAFGHTYGEN